MIALNENVSTKHLEDIIPTHKICVLKNTEAFTPTDFFIGKSETRFLEIVQGNMEQGSKYVLKHFISSIN